MRVEMIVRQDKKSFSKLPKFLMSCAKILLVLVAVGSIGVVYILDQQFKIKHYNLMMTMCSKKPGAIVTVTASTPVLGSGVEITCEYVNPHHRIY